MRQFLLETERLLMRPHELGDVDFMVELNSDPDVVKFVGKEKTTRDQAIEIVASLSNQFRERKMGRFMLLEKKMKQPIGWCGLKWIPERKVVDVGYRLMKKAWGKGYATESGRECLRYGFIDLDLQTIVAGADPENHASIAVLKKLGLNPTGASRREAGHTYLDFVISKAEFLLTNF